jgi:hypothetical protein
MMDLLPGSSHSPTAVAAKRTATKPSRSRPPGSRCAPRGPGLRPLASSSDCVRLQAGRSPALLGAVPGMRCGACFLRGGSRALALRFHQGRIWVSQGRGPHSSPAASSARAAARFGPRARRGGRAPLGDRGTRPLAAAGPARQRAPGRLTGEHTPGERRVGQPVPSSGSARAPLLAEPARQRRAEPPAPARGGVGTPWLAGTTTRERSTGRGTPGGLEGRARSTRPRRRKHRSDRRERGAQRVADGGAREGFVGGLLAEEAGGVCVICRRYEIRIWNYSINSKFIDKEGELT